MTTSQKKELENLISIHAALLAQEYSFLTKRQRLIAVKQILRDFWNKTYLLREQVQQEQDSIESAKSGFAGKGKS